MFIFFTFIFMNSFKKISTKLGNELAINVALSINFDFNFFFYWYQKGYVFFCILSWTLKLSFKLLC